jgi:rSAM/selenodomain-associated transferase 1
LKEALVLMAKAPITGEVKTRLIGPLSPDEATELYINFLADTFALMEDARDERENLSLVLSYTPEGQEEAFEAVERQGSMMIAQRGDGLGERLYHCFGDLFEAGFDSIVVIGGDSPTLPLEFLIDAFNLLENPHDFVLGPAEDEGYYLIGMRSLNRSIFENIPWGKAGVLSATKERAVESGLNLRLLPVWYDIDSPQELDRLREDLKSGRGLAEYTRRFLKKTPRVEQRKELGSLSFLILSSRCFSWCFYNATYGENVIAVIELQSCAGADYRPTHRWTKPCLC